MANTDPRIDAYISKAEVFAIPILQQLRKLVHLACPDVKETMKWSFPHFDYHDTILCSMAAFKHHCTFVLWKAELIKSAVGILEITDRSAMGHLGRITSLKNLPADKAMIKIIKEAGKLNAAGIKTPRAKPVKTEKEDLKLNPALVKALAQNKTAQNFFNASSYSFQKEYNMWIDDAKSELTRNTRIANAIEWIAEGKGRNWKYEKPKK